MVADPTVKLVQLIWTALTASVGPGGEVSGEPQLWAFYTASAVTVALLGGWGYLLARRIGRRHHLYDSKSRSGSR